MKTCCMCKQNLDESSFRKNSKKHDGLQCQCILCQKKYRQDHYKKNQQKYIDKAALYKKAFAIWWAEYKSGFTCSVCQESDPACLDFHHLGNKDNDIAQLAGLCSKEKLLKELKKCIPLCSNCHRKLHRDQRH